MPSAWKAEGIRLKVKKSEGENEDCRTLMVLDILTGIAVIGQLQDAGSQNIIH
jgi:hypothetical protein